MALVNKIASYFEFGRHRTNFKTEILAGISTFLALSYIFVVNPSILGQAGMNKSMVLFATIIASAVSTLAMGLWAKKPFVLAPGMEMNAYVAFFVILGLGFSWQQALGAVFWSGVIFFVLTLTKVRMRIINAIPDKMKSGLALCVGVFLMLIALRLAGVVVYEGVKIQGIGVLVSAPAAVLYIGLAMVLILRKLRVPGAVLISIALSSVLAHVLGLGAVVEPVAVSKDMLSGLFKLDMSVILNPRIFSVILILFVIDFYGSIAKFIGLSRKTSIVNGDGSMPHMKEAMIVDGTANSLGAVLGTTSLITYVESAVGIAEGGRTGLTAVVCGALMLGFIVLTPVVNLVPLITTTGALFWVGITLFPTRDELVEQYGKLDVLTTIAMVVSVIVTFAIDKALFVGFVVFIGGLLVAKRFKEIDPYLLGSAVLLGVGVVLSVT